MEFLAFRSQDWIRIVAGGETVSGGTMVVLGGGWILVVNVGNAFGQDGIVVPVGIVILCVPVEIVRFGFEI